MIDHFNVNFFHDSIIFVVHTNLCLDCTFFCYSVKEKKALKLNKHNQYNHTPKMVKSINLFIIL